MTLTFVETPSKQEEKEEETPKIDLSLIHTPSTVLCITYIAERGEVWTGTRDGHICIFDDRSGNLKQKFEAHNDEVIFKLLLLKKDALLILSCATDNRVKVICKQWFDIADNWIGVESKHMSSCARNHL